MWTVQSGSWPRRARGVLVRVMAMATLALTASKVSAETIIQDTHVPFSFTAFNSCTGELFGGTGFFHHKVTLATAPNSRFHFEANVESAQGTTLSGARYVFNQQGAFHITFDTDSAPANHTAESMQHFTRQGEDGSLVAGDDLYLRFKAHFTINASGVATVQFSEFTVDCK